MSVYLSAGHSNADPGAVAFGRKESDIAVEFRNIVSFYLTREGVEHDLDGLGTVNLPLAEAVRGAKRHPIAVEFHCNAAASLSARGVETLSKPKDYKQGGRICAAISDSLGIPSRGAKPEASGQHHRLAFVQAGGIIVELFFLTSKADLAAYDARKWLAGKAVAEVLERATRALSS